MIPTNNPEPFIYLAPIKGITDALFRTILLRHFGGFSGLMAPFINPQNSFLLENRLLKDVLPENNPAACNLVPQLLHTTPEPFITLANRLADLGFTHVNWNLGCPAPMVAKKQRGSGMLPHTDLILGFLDAVLPKIRTELSIKTRLGFASKTEIATLLPLIDHYPLKEIIIHPRLGKQLYRGTTDIDGFAMCLELSRHSLVYNGDIVDAPSFAALANRFPSIGRWMLGRGVLANPMLAEELTGVKATVESDKIFRLMQFHQELFQKYRQLLSGPGHLLGRMKLIWSYLILSFPGQQKQLKKIQKCNTIAHYLQIVDDIFRNNH
ncbi:tRNA-dihydrouridine synthase family protein [Desulforhopalus singaporensis]|uniref:tRNA-dihydrouridine synthase n=1 Tax=Desulforhopalus singaporensis TaxID=91360 RepID=A0A1H0UKT6_9BACT|nr:tRNA-dihydrouridine synthase family protein [Desulforhopalus singaporensis]SDP66764.1 tRNA-U20a,U20b-dihydrouridine synthase [Desulforhopalus singaporensis]